MHVVIFDFASPDSGRHQEAQCRLTRPASSVAARRRACDSPGVAHWGDRSPASLGEALAGRACRESGANRRRGAVRSGRRPRRTQHPKVWVISRASSFRTLSCRRVKRVTLAKTLVFERGRGRAVPSRMISAYACDRLPPPCCTNAPSLSPAIGSGIRSFRVSPPMRGAGGGSWSDAGVRRQRDGQCVLREAEVCEC
jgi:hypothetical protein